MSAAAPTDGDAPKDAANAGAAGNDGARNDTTNANCSGGGHRILAPADTATLSAIVDRIFPADDELPAASALGVVDYIDGQLAGPWGAGDDLYRDGPFVEPTHSGHGWQWDLGPREAYAEGLAALRRIAQERHGRPFEQLGGDEQDELLRATEAGDLEPFGELPTDAFFALLYANVLEGLFTHPIHGGNRGKAAWKWIGYPG